VDVKALLMCFQCDTFAVYLWSPQSYCFYLHLVSHSRICVNAWFTLLRLLLFGLTVYTGDGHLLFCVQMCTASVICKLFTGSRTGRQMG